MEAPLRYSDLPLELWPALALPLSQWSSMGLGRGVTCYRSKVNASRTGQSNPERLDSTLDFNYKDAFEILDNTSAPHLGLEERLLLYGLWRKYAEKYSDSVDPLCPGISQRNSCINPVLVRYRRERFGLHRTGLLWVITEYLRILHYPMPRELHWILSDPENLQFEHYQELDKVSLCMLYGYESAEQECSAEVEKGKLLVRSLKSLRRRIEPRLLRRLAELLMEGFSEALMFPPRGSILYRALVSFPQSCNAKVAFWYYGVEGLEFADPSNIESILYNEDAFLLRHGHAPLTIMSCSVAGSRRIIVVDDSLGLAAWWPYTPGGVEAARDLALKLYLSTCTWSLQPHVTGSADEDTDSPYEILGFKRDNTSIDEILNAIEKKLVKPPPGSWAKLLPGLYSYAQSENIMKTRDIIGLNDKASIIAEKVLRKTRAPEYCLSTLRYLKEYEASVPGLTYTLLEECGILMDSEGERVESMIENCREITDLIANLLYINIKITHS
ncbi:MAG: hypothetical protein GSR83_03590 [Desulfurococcales archaeon]|nr:hypothetical protein [Desulfurococcales archaeon]